MSSPLGWQPHQGAEAGDTSATSGDNGAAVVGLHDDTGHADLVLLKATIQRLRQQRQQVERLKWESRQQKATIEALRAENSRLDAELSHLVDVRSENSRLSSKATLLEEKVANLREELKVKQDDVAQAIQAQRQAEASFRDSAARSEHAHNRAEAELRAQVAALERYVQEHKASTEKASVDRQVLETRLASYKADMATLERKLKDAQHASEEQTRHEEERFAKLAENKGESDAQVRQLTKAVTELETAATMQQQQVDDLKRTIQRLRAERDKAEELVAEARRRVASEGADNSRAQQTLRHDLEEALALVKAKDSVIDKQDVSLAQLRAMLAKEQEATAAQDATLKSLTNDVTSAQSLLDTANNTNRKLAHRIGDLESLYKAAQSEVNHMTKLYTQLKADVQRERMERQSFARARLDLLNEVTAEDDKLQRALDASFAHLGAAQPFGDAPGGGAPPSPIPHHRNARAHGTGRRGRGSALDASLASGGYARAAAGGRGKVLGSGSQEG